MVQLFWRSFCRQIRRNGSVSLVLLIGMVVSALCISIMLGSAQGQYRLVAGYSEYATLTINLSESSSEEGKKIAEMLPDTFADSIANVLYLTVSGEDILYIGWQGYQQERWFPHTAGRFFSSGEQAGGIMWYTFPTACIRPWPGRIPCQSMGRPIRSLAQGGLHRIIFGRAFLPCLPSAVFRRI